MPTNTITGEKVHTWSSQGNLSAVTSGNLSQVGFHFEVVCLFAVG